MGLVILGSGISLPEARVTSRELDASIGKPLGWLEEETGVRSRPRVGSETQISMAKDAIEAALKQAAVGLDEVDLIISACGIGYQTLPSTAPLIQRALGIGDGRSAAYDVNATCLSFVAALDMVAAFFAAGRYRTAVIVSSEIASRALPWEEQPDVAGLFGDGAGAVVVRCAEGTSGIVAADFKTYPSAYEACQIGAGGTRYDFQHDREAFEAAVLFAMNGKELFRVTSKHFKGFVRDLLRTAGWRETDVDVVIPHQASPFALAHMIRQCGFSAEQVVDIARDFGNQIAASIPITLHMAREAGRLPPGTRALLLGTSAGVSFGGIALVV